MANQAGYMARVRIQCDRGKLDEVVARLEEIGFVADPGVPGHKGGRAILEGAIPRGKASKIHEIGHILHCNIKYASP